jgi:hypothetical protein
MDLPADSGLSLIAFSAEAGSPDDDALKLLASWAATHDPADALATPTPSEPDALAERWHVSGISGTLGDQPARRSTAAATRSSVAVSAIRTRWAADGP